jgi:hypothetical protein
MWDVHLMSQSIAPKVMDIFSYKGVKEHPYNA